VKPEPPAVALAVPTPETEDLDKGALIMGKKKIMAKKKTWKEMPPAARIGTVLIGIAQISLMLAAQRDISRRPAEQINGPKAAWRVAALLNFVGPMGYFIFGRKRTVTGK
jgi:hypothetical protein